jgi:hypothetical protein
MMCFARGGVRSLITRPPEVNYDPLRIAPL